MSGLPSHVFAVTSEVHEVEVQFFQTVSDTLAKSEALERLFASLAPGDHREKRLARRRHLRSCCLQAFRCSASLCVPHRGRMHGGRDASLKVRVLVIVTSFLADF